ncbi:MAG: ABC transporter permease [Alphaproteobacteria bacterium]|nr:ABC transporter permease [Alphaproteobacteria bacterium]
MSWFSKAASETQITHGSRVWLYILAGLVMVFLVAPTVIVIPMSFSESQYLEFPPRTWSVRWYEHYFASSEWMAATRTSVLVAFFTMLVATPLGVMAAYGLFVSNLRFAHLIFLLLISPMMVPVVLIAIGVFYVYAKLKMVHTVGGLVLAHSMLAIPLVLIVVSSALKSYDMNQEMVARSLGASRLRAFMVITLPQIRFALITSALLSFITSFDEVIVALFVSGGDNATLTRSMFITLRDQIDPTIASISTIMVLVSTSLLVMAQMFGQNKDGT